MCEACVRRGTPGPWWVRAREGGERAGGDHLSPHFTKLGSRRSKGLALADNLSLERDNLRLPLVQLGMRLSNLSQRGVPDAGRALRTLGNGSKAALASWGLGPRLGLVVHGQINQDRSRRVLLCYFPYFFRTDGQTQFALKEGGVVCAAVLQVRLAPSYPHFTICGEFRGGAHPHVTLRHSKFNYDTAACEQFTI